MIVAIADKHGISVHDAASVAAARAVSGQLVRCEVHDLLSRDLAVLPRIAVRHAAEGQATSPDAH